MATQTHTVTIDRTQRPKTYFWPLSLETQLLTHVKGAARRAELQRLIDEGRLDELPDDLARASLPDDQRSAIAGIHPMLMGGEYLPDQEDGEVEIARIELASTTCDVTSVYARREGPGIHYRVVDEYGGDTLNDVRECSSDEPMTLGELCDFFMDAWPLLDVLHMNEFDLDSALCFFGGRSEFYPQFDALLRENVREAYGTTEDEEEEEEEEEEEDGEEDTDD